ncbi:porin family protein [Ramlibacter algicola]|uniref:Porin family protein n=1 Tax=Ramlibacter algicola TaxID=2795217 RepID=A0A934UQJ7_9BURK|nr:porin family protein [Ramlibacter algicola]MBK0391597.1 porin family protein [Ramlibacter algicola]
MKKCIAFAAAAAALLIAGGAQAQARTAASPLYGELGYTQLKLSGEGLSVKPNMIRGIVGYDFHPNFAVEGMLAFGAGDDSQTFTESAGGTTATGTVNLKVQNAYGVYLKPKADLGAVELFGRLGYTHARVKGSEVITVNGALFSSDSATDSDGGFSYGLGANWKFTPNAYVGVDYMHYYKKDGVKAEGFTVGVGFRF